MTWKGWEGVTEADLRVQVKSKQVLVHRAEVSGVRKATPRKQKYGAVPHTVLPDLRVLPADECGGVAGGIRFASKREALRMVDLMLDKEAGRISDLELQPQYTLTVVSPSGTRMVIGRYLADFRYQRDGQTIVEDVKGMKTAVYEWKKKHVQIEHAIVIIET